MSYLLDGQEIRRPYTIDEGNSVQVAQNRTLSGAITRDYFGSKKRVWKLEYRNTNKTDYDIINAIYNDYLTTETTQTWQVTETNYTVAEVRVHVDLEERSFNVRGEDYLSDFDLILTEA